MKSIEENDVYFHFNKSKLIDNFKKFNEYGIIYYPLKTNSNLNILKELENLNYKYDNGFLISSITNFETLRKLEVDASRMCFINVCAENETIKLLYENGVRFFTFDNIKSLIEFSKYANLNETKVVIRISTMQVFNNKFTHLGADFDETIEMINFLKGKCSRYGISFYIQNNLKKEEKSLEKIAKFIEEKYINCGMKFINIGGVDEISSINKDVLYKLKEKIKIDELILEIGRNLVENAVELRTRIIREKIINNKKVIIIKNGIYSGFFDTLLYNKQFSIHFISKNGDKVKIEYQKTQESDYEFTMCGGSSDSGDILGKMYIDSKYKDELVENAEFCVENVGAYFEEFFMPYSNDLNKVYIMED